MKSSEVVLKQDGDFDLTTEAKNQLITDLKSYINALENQNQKNEVIIMRLRSDLIKEKAKN